MADPGTILGTAVGVLSLGIQVCQGLYELFSVVHGRNKELDTVSTQIQCLVSLFQDLNTILPSIASLPRRNTTGLNTLIQCINESEIKINELQSLHSSLQNTATGTNDLKGILRETGRGLTFLLRRNELQSMRQAVSSLVTTVQLAIDTINTDLNISQSVELANIAASVHSQQRTLRDGIDNVNHNIKNTRADTEKAMSLINTSETTIVAAVTKSGQESQDQGATILAQLQTKFEELELLVKTQHEERTTQLLAMQSQQSHELAQLHRRVLERPALLQSTCDAAGYEHHSTVEFRRSSSRQVKVKPTIPTVCWCDLWERELVTSQHQYKVGTIVLHGKRAKTVMHWPGCAFHRATRNTARVGARIQVAVCRGLSLLVEATISCTTGAGGFSIGPRLNCKVIVDASPAHEAIEDLNWRRTFPAAEFSVQRIESVESRLLALYRDGRVTPYEQNQEGETHLHTIVRVVSYKLQYLGADATILARLMQFIATLASAGVPTDEVDNSGRTILDICAEKKCRVQSELAGSTSYSIPLTDIARLMEFPTINSGDEYPLSKLQALMCHPELIQDVGLSPLATAILSRSESQVRSILSSMPETVSDRTSGMTVLHLSATWPTGLAILLSAGADKFVDAICCEKWIEKGEPITALDLAIYFSCVDAVTLLMRNGAPWSCFILHGSPILFDLRWIFLGPTSEIASHVANELAARRKALYNLAKTVLPIGDFSLAGSTDTESASLVRRIIETGRSVSLDLFVPPHYEGIYLSGRLVAEHFPIFFQAGFQDINSPNRSGLRPIMFAQLVANYSHISDPRQNCHQILSLATLSWLDDHSCLDRGPEDPLGLGLNKSACGWLYLAINTLRQISIGPNHSISANLFNNAYLFLERVFREGIRDDCCCWCSIELSCSPFTRFLISIRGIWPPLNLLKFIKPFAEEYPEEFLRFITFEALQMTHTCCSVDFVYIEEAFGGKRTVLALMNFNGSIKEIRDEEKEMGQRLEILLEEFQHELNRSEETLIDFIFGYWRRRIREECTPSEEEIYNLRAAGCVPSEDDCISDILWSLFGSDFFDVDEQ